MNHPAPAAPITAAEWLIGIGPKLEQIKAEELHDEHVEAWLQQVNDSKDPQAHAEFLRVNRYVTMGIK